MSYSNRKILAILLALLPVSTIILSHSKYRFGEIRVSRPSKFIAREEWGSNPDPIPDSRRHTPKWITFHHAARLWNDRDSPIEFLKKMQINGKKRPTEGVSPHNDYWPDLPYHFLIAPDGTIFEGRPLEYEPDSNTAYSKSGNIGIELMGDFNLQNPKSFQLDSAAELTAWLMQQYQIELKQVRTHRDIAATECPGANLYRLFHGGQFSQRVSNILTGNLQSPWSLQ